MRDPEHLQVQNEIPGAEEYCDLRRLAGLSPRDLASARTGLPNTLFSAIVRDGSQLVAMGRVVGDGGCNFEIVDVAVHPAYQRSGLGSAIMQAITEYLNANAAATAYISLIADHFSPALYARFGFEPVAPKSIGMARRRPQK